jgi:ureidoglycolate lyase
VLNTDIIIEALTAASFEPFGEVLEISGPPSSTINQGKCHRHHDLATLDIIDGRPGVSLFNTSACSLPHCLDLVERHPLGSQAFLPMSTFPFLIVAAEDEDGSPVRPRAWLTNGTQGVNYHKGIWHGVLTALHEPALFAVVDRIGSGANLEEFEFNPPYRVVDAHGYALAFNNPDFS